MAALKLFVFTLLLSLVLTGIGVYADSMSDVEDELRSDGQHSAVLEQLQSKIHSLQYHIEEKIQEIKDKDAVVAAKEKIIKENTDIIALLESEIATLKETGDSDAEQLTKADAISCELEKQVEKLKKDLDMQIKDKKQLEARVAKAEKRKSELRLKADNLQNIIDEHKTKLRKTERALQIAEEEIMKAKFEATSKTKELMEVHDAWFPPWLAVHLSYYQSILEKNWEVHGKPTLEPFMEKATEKMAQAEEWARPHLEKWVPAIKEKWVVITSKAEPHLQAVSAKTWEIYVVSKNVATPHFVKVVQLVDPYFQVLRRVSKPYIDRVATAVRPHVDSLNVALKPYTKEAVHAYGKFLESATTCHHQVQNTVHEKLKSRDLTKPLATKELVWFAASALLALPFIFLFKICSAVFCKKSKEHVQSGNASSTNRRVEHAHLE